MTLKTTFTLLGVALCGLVVNAEDVAALQRKAAAKAALAAAAAIDPMEAVWTNGAGDGDVTNPANWSCTDGEGLGVDNVLPSAGTQVRISNVPPLSIPAGTVYGGISLGDCTLAGDLDLCGHGPVEVEGTVDLNGHRLFLADLKGTAASAITDATGGGELHLVVPAGKTVVNERIALSGAFKIVKEGPGAFVGQRPAFRHYRFVVLRPWGSTAAAMQYSEFKLLDGETDVTPLRSGFSWLESSELSATAMPTNAVDGSVGTKYVDKRCAGNRYAQNKGNVYIQLDYDAPRPITGYDWATANDRPNDYGSDERDPADWQLLGSDDGETWVTIDERMEYYATTARNTWVGPFELSYKAPRIEVDDMMVSAGSVKLTGEMVLSAGTGVISTTNSIPVIDLNGQTVAVRNAYDQGTLVNNATSPATVVLGRGDADATLGFVPPANVQLRKEGAGTLTVNGQAVDNLAIAQGGVVFKKPAFRHYRFVVLRPWGSTAFAMQYSEFKLLDGETDVTPRRSGFSWLASPEISTTAIPPNVVDGDLSTKYFDRRCAGGSYAANKGNVYIQLDYDEPQSITGYDWATANDRPNDYGSDERDPTDWLLLGSDDGETWITLDRRTNYYATTVRNTWVGPFALANSLNVTSESADTSLTLDGVSLSAERLHVGAINLVQGATLSIPQYKWFRFSIKQVEEGKDMQISELALYDAAGNRVNAGLTLGSSATTLASGKAFASHAGASSASCADKLFDSNMDTKWCVPGSTAPAPENASTWFVVTMRLADVVAPVASYNIATGGDSASQWGRNPKTWTLEGSVDGVNWVTVDERSVGQGPHANKVWYNNGSPYKKPEMFAAIVAGSGQVVKASGGDTMFQGAFTGDVDLKVEAGRFTLIPEFSRCKWYRFSIKQLEGYKDMQISELALYDAAGNRVNVDLPLGSSAEALASGTAFASHTGVSSASCANKLFDNDMGTKWCVAGSVEPALADASTWLVVTMRLADDAAPVASYNIATGGDSATQWKRNPKTWSLEVSADGVNWLVVDEQAVSGGPHENKVWYNGGSPYTVLDGIVDSPAAAASLGTVSVAAGAELNLPPALPVKGLVVDAAGAGRVNKLDLAPGGVIDIVNAPSADFKNSDVDYCVPLTIGALSGVAGSWRVRINGVACNGLRLRAVDNALYIRQNVFMVIIR